MSIIMSATTKGPPECPCPVGLEFRLLSGCVLTSLTASVGLRGATIRAVEMLRGVAFLGTIEAWVAVGVALARGVALACELNSGGVGGVGTVFISVGVAGLLALLLAFMLVGPWHRYVLTGRPVASRRSLRRVLDVLVGCVLMVWVAKREMKLVIRRPTFG